MKKAAKY